MKATIYFLLLMCLSCNAQDSAYHNYSKSLKDLLVVNPTSGKQLKIYIDKSEYKLSFILDSLTLKEYPVVFGGNSKDDKLREGDQCTPEGIFKMRTKYPHKSWSKFIWIDYPNTESWAKHRRAKTLGKIPQNASIGGEIGIHGVPQGTDNMIDLRINWTLGCISLKNKDIDELYPHFDEHTIIEIVK